MDIDRGTNAVFERKERDVLKASQFLRGAAMSVLISQCLLGKVFATDEVGFDSSKNSLVTDKVYVSTDVIGSGSKFVTTDSLASQDKKATCPVPPPKKKSQPKPALKPETSAKPIVPAMTNVCSPVINIQLPSGASVLYPQGAHGGLSPDSAPAKEPQAAIIAPTEPTQPPNSFKFKIKDLVEAEITTQSSAMTWVLITIFAGLLVLAVLSWRTAKRLPKSSLPRLIAVISITLAALLAYYLFRSPPPVAIEDSTFERLYADLKVSKSLPFAEPNPADSMLGQQLAIARAEITQMQSQLSTQRDHAAELERRNDYYFWWQILALLSLGAAACCVIFYRRSRNLRLDADIPLDELYRLEDVLSTYIATPSIVTDLKHDHQEVQLNELLLAVNRARKLLESGSGAKVWSEEKPATFFVLTDSNQYTRLKRVLLDLDNFLFSRYDQNKEVWQKVAIKELADARREILLACKVRPVDMDPSIN